MLNRGFVWMVAWPDFRSRLTRFMVIGLGMALVMAVTLLLAAFSEGFRLRSERLLDVFDADREPDQRVGHFENRSLYRHVRHGVGELDQGFDSPEALSEEEEFEGCDIGECGLEAYPEFTLGSR